MVNVEFKAKKLLGKIPVKNELKNYYEQVVRLFVESELSYLNLKKLNAIIIPNDFLQDVLDFQHEKGLANPNVTNTKYARAYGKMIYIPEEDGFYVFVDADKATFMVDDRIFEVFFSGLKKDDYEQCLIERKQAFNLLAHELSHVELESNISIDISTETLQGQVVSMWKQIFEEYYACRRASRIYGEVSIIQHNEEYLNDIEREIMTQRGRYNYRQISLDDFCKVFHKYARMSLIHVVSELGCSKELNIKVAYENVKVGKYILDLNNEFNEMYEMVYNEGRLIVSEKLIKLAFDYFAEFRIFISETEEGIRYDIPVLGEREP